MTSSAPGSSNSEPGTQKYVLISPTLYEILLKNYQKTKGAGAEEVVAGGGEDQETPAPLIPGQYLEDYQYYYQGLTPPSKLRGGGKMTTTTSLAPKTSDTLDDKYRQLLDQVPLSAKHKRREYFQILKIIQNYPEFAYDSGTGEILDNKGSNLCDILRIVTGREVGVKATPARDLMEKRIRKGEMKPNTLQNTPGLEKFLRFLAGTNAGSSVIRNRQLKAYFDYIRNKTEVESLQAGGGGINLLAQYNTQWATVSTSKT